MDFDMKRRDEVSSLERSREALYSPNTRSGARRPLPPSESRRLPHAWEEKPLPKVANRGARRIRFASVFFGLSVAFFLVTLGVAGYFFYFGGNSVSTDKVAVDIQGPTTIAGGDTVPLTITITNTNPVAIENATVEVDFPDGTRSATDIAKAYPRYVEDLGTLAPGTSVTRSIKAIIFGGAGQTVALPVSLSYGTSGSNAIFEKKSTYAIAISSTPLSLSVDALTEVVSGAPITFTLSVRSNATVSLDNVVLVPTLPFGFSVISSSVPMSGGSIPIGTLAPGANKTVTLSGMLVGQDSENRIFHFTVGTAKSTKDQTLGVAYMTQDAGVSIAAPFIAISLALNGSTGTNLVLTPASSQSVTLTYTNTLPTTVTDVTITVAVSGTAVDYDSLHAENGFYNSSDHTIVFSKDDEPALASLPPGASGVGSFTFSTVSAGGQAPSVTFSTSVSGTRIGQANVPEAVHAVMTATAKVATAVALSAATARTSGALGASGPVPPVADQPTTYTIVWDVANAGSAIAGGTVTATLPTYVTYTGKTLGTGSFAYDSASRTVTWNVGDLAQNGRAEGVFQVSITPSTSQRGSAPALTSQASFSGYDRYAGVSISASALPPTTDMGSAGSGIVQ
jgi:uncharacterized repeat protein (TIGR01451 family)